MTLVIGPGVDDGDDLVADEIGSWSLGPVMTEGFGAVSRLTKGSISSTRPEPERLGGFGSTIADSQGTVGEDHARPADQWHRRSQGRPAAGSGRRDRRR